ncbi:hypothetical protein GCM10009557_19450 [Virgisporangium ochraceum]|uniref:Uncharacterized protein n=1 Tax=Virgisporangium ochraceum TaxID=65505 RepID=A0A8J4A371_9ACTN|nr:hypothetical protein Voc01_079370 [Virgisporangium ochraceum]
MFSGSYPSGQRCRRRVDTGRVVVARAIYGPLSSLTNPQSVPSSRKERCYPSAEFTAANLPGTGHRTLHPIYYAA